MPPSKTENPLPGDFRLFSDEREIARIPSRVTAVESFIEVCAFIAVSCHLAMTMEWMPPQPFRVSALYFNREVTCIFST